MDMRGCKESLDAFSRKADYEEISPSSSDSLESIAVRYGVTVRQTAALLGFYLLLLILTHA